MNKVITKCLLDMIERERTLPVLMGRILGIRKQLNIAAGVMKSITEAKMARQPRYYSQLLLGWQEHLALLSNELLLLHAELAKQLTATMEK